VGEYGGIGAFVAGKEWVGGGCYTYKKENTPKEAAELFIQMAATLRSRTGTLSAAIYTQVVLYI